ncbi:MAG: bifunctional methylenetetrahydrofolate dehydrogenase/methenyltetrahydrofolate cyclohydrolase [Paludibacteraceae bacterium]|nr:bifunctional methylenetetrahydrofolate dehydrogenase/methenyltetrahydrofolate cyclohydrolase [Paludibacteraceae bacterium]
MYINGEKDAAEKSAELRNEIAILKEKGMRAPHLAIVTVGNYPLLDGFVARKIKACEEVGIEAEQISYSEYITEQTLQTEIQRLNNDSRFDGFIFQFPLPHHLNKQHLLSAIDYRKDVGAEEPKAEFFTPVPGGDGPSSIISMMQNMLQACKFGA